MKIISYTKKHEEDFRECIYRQMLYVRSVDSWKVLPKSRKASNTHADYLLKEISEKIGKIYMAYEGDICVGCVVGSYYPEANIGYGAKINRGFIHELFIHERFRGQGIGTKLGKKIQKFLTQKGAQTIGFTVMHDNMRARNLYEKLGFEYRSHFMGKRVG